MAKIQPRRTFTQAEELAQKLINPDSPQRPITLQIEHITPQNILDVYRGTDMENSALRYINKSNEIGRAYAVALADPANLSAHGREVLGTEATETYALKARLRLASNKYDLRLLNKQKAAEIQLMHQDQLLQVGRLVQEVGLPGMSLPTTSPYNYYLNLLVSPGESAERNTSSCIGSN
jgi:hypothetical protein